MSMNHLDPRQAQTIYYLLLYSSFLVLWKWSCTRLKNRKQKCLWLVKKSFICFCLLNHSKFYLSAISGSNTKSWWPCWFLHLANKIKPTRSASFDKYLSNNWNYNSDNDWKGYLLSSFQNECILYSVRKKYRWQCALRQLEILIIYDTMWFLNNNF